MFIVTINSVDSSEHTLLVDANDQKARFESEGKENIEVIEKSTFNPPNN
jgi:hypothetical protein